MRNSVIGYAALVLMLQFHFTGCEAPANKLIDNNDRKIERAQLELKHARTIYLLQWHKFKIETEREIELNQMKIDGFSDLMENAGPKEIKKYKKRISVLLFTNRELHLSLEEYTSEGHIGKNKESNQIAMD